MQSNPSISVNLLVISAKILVNLLAKLTRTNPIGGCHRGPWAQGIDTGRFAPATFLPLGAPGSPWAFMFLPGWPQGPWPPAGGGRIRSGRGSAWEIFPYYSHRHALPRMAPKYSGTVRGSRRAIPGRTRFFYSQSVLYSYMLLFEHARVFFGGFLESRNHKIQIGVQVGRKSAVVLSGTTEASYSHFFVGIDFDC